MKKTIVILMITFVLASIIISGCSSQDRQIEDTQVQPKTSSNSEVRNEDNNGDENNNNNNSNSNVEISNFAFTPNTITISKGSSIVWTNLDSAPHTIVSDTGDELNSESLSKGGTFSHTFNSPGTYEYHCGIHPSMKAKVIVE